MIFHNANGYQFQIPMMNHDDEPVLCYHFLWFLFDPMGEISENFVCNVFDCFMLMSIYVSLHTNNT